jgi:hypothetical protein
LLQHVYKSAENSAKNETSEIDASLKEIALFAVAQEPAATGGGVTEACCQQSMLPTLIKLARAQNLT